VTIQLRQRTEHELVPLVAERLARNVAALRNSVANVLVESGYAARKLPRNTCDELACMADVSAAT